MLKRLFLALALFTITAVTTLAQNANRSGVFVELGGGGIVGSTPHVSSQNYIDYDNLHGFAVDFSAGYRFATSDCFAVGAKIGAMLPVSCADYLTLKLMPQVRFTTPDFIAGRSLYAGLALGVIYSGSSTVYKSNCENYSFDTLGGGYDIDLGINFSDSFYAGIQWSAVFGAFEDVEERYGNGVHDFFSENSHWGSLGLRLGYRF